VSPLDENLIGTNLRCESLTLCGMGLGPYGYTPCVLGTSMSRIWGYEALNHLWECTSKKLLKMCEEYCQHCGWYLVDSDDRSKGKIYDYPNDFMSKSWLQKFNGNYNEGL
jgi:hypothetical protein